ncbi:MAG: flagellar type III secretion system pore protein FliP [Gemmatimonadaceae bacterium]|jgi:flagellar biosynthetic protein FliP|nr:flagellar type III secretion system pore protein FliP [Gemmatimonadaceae bacterium]
MLTASLGILAALAFVLGLIALAVWALRRWGAGGFRSRATLPVEVVQRLPLGPKSGLAVVRVGEKVLVVSHGEGGIHTLCDVDEADRQRVLAGSELPLAFNNTATATEQYRASKGISFAQSMRSAIEGAARGSSSNDAKPTVPTEPAAAAVPRVVPAAAPAVALDRDLRTALSMTLAPATRLLGLMAVAALGAFAPIGSAVAQPAAPAAQPAAAVTQAAATPARQPAREPATEATDTPTTAAPTGGTTAPVIPQLDLRVGEGGAQELRLNGTVSIVLMMGLLTLVPTLILMMTGFTRILIVLNFLKQAMGTQSAPPAHLVAGLALLLTGFVMAPTLSEANRTALQPWLAGEIEQVDMLKEGVKPFRAFMLRQTKEADLRTFVELSRIAPPATPDDVPLHVLMAAFVSSELRTAFQIGFAIYLPFIVIDAVVASVLMAMGMFMLPPAMISLPFKLLLFVLVDGWSLTIQSLIQSFR